MHAKRYLLLALASVLSVTAIGASAQPVDPAATPLQPVGIEDADVDRRCLEATGSRVTADPQPATPEDQSERNGSDCTIGNGTVYTRDDLDRTGHTTVEEALRALDPRVF